jgi:hypothetical protein
MSRRDRPCCVELLSCHPAQQQSTGSTPASPARAWGLSMTAVSLRPEPAANGPVLNARFRNRFVLTDSTDRMAGLYSLRSDEVAAFMVYRDASGAPGHQRSGSPRERLRREFAGLGQAVDRPLELCPEHPYDDVVAQVVMPGWQRGRTVLVGDACGAVSLSNRRNRCSRLSLPGAAGSGSSDQLFPGLTRLCSSSSCAGASLSPSGDRSMSSAARPGAGTPEHSSGAGVPGVSFLFSGGDVASFRVSGAGVTVRLGFSVVGTGRCVMWSPYLLVE